MSKSNLKLLAQKAKNRLKTISQNYNEQEKSVKSAGLSLHQYALIATNIKIEDDPLYKKVEKMLEKDPDTSSPIGELIDKKQYANLSETQKERYILSLAKRYRKIKENIMSKNFST